MQTLKGKYSKAKIFTDDIEQEAIDQIKTILDSKIVEDCQVRIMPDVHAGKSSPIGCTQTFNGKVCPNVVSVDIGCGMQVLKINKQVGDKFFGTEEKLKQLDTLVRENIPMGAKNKTSADEWTLAAKKIISHLICFGADKNTELKQVQN